MFFRKSSSKLDRHIVAFIVLFPDLRIRWNNHDVNIEFLTKTVPFLESIFPVFMAVDKISLTDFYDFKMRFQRRDFKHLFVIGRQVCVRVPSLGPSFAKNIITLLSCI